MKGDYMRKSISLWQFVGFAFTSLCGTLLHFLYEWTGQNPVAAAISAVNESTWEHMKILFFPMFIFAIIESLVFREYKNFWCIKLRGILLGLLLIPVLFYTYNGAFGASPDWLNIAFFFISDAIVYIYETKQFKKESTMCISPTLALILLCLIAAIFVVFTFLTPELPIFADPLTGKYGI